MCRGFGRPPAAEMYPANRTRLQPPQHESKQWQPSLVPEHMLPSTQLLLLRPQHLVAPSWTAESRPSHRFPPRQQAEAQMCGLHPSHSHLHLRKSALPLPSGHCEELLSIEENGCRRRELLSRDLIPSLVLLTCDQILYFSRGSWPNPFSHLL